MGTCPVYPYLPWTPFSSSISSLHINPTFPKLVPSLRMQEQPCWNRPQPNLVQHLEVFQRFCTATLISPRLNGMAIHGCSRHHPDVNMFRKAGLIKLTPTFICLTHFILMKNWHLVYSVRMKHSVGTAAEVISCLEDRLTALYWFSIKKRGRVVVDWFWLMSRPIEINGNE